MARSITPERQELRAEAIQLRKAGWSQPEISLALTVPRQTITRWCIPSNTETSRKCSQTIVGSSRNSQAAHNLPNPIALFPCKYEEVGDGIAPGSVDLILTDPPYLVSENDITRNNQAALQRDFGKWDKSPEALALEAKNLREFGYTQQEIADALGVPQPTLCRWLAKVNNGKQKVVSNGKQLSKITLTRVSTLNITLYPCRYEESAQHIEPRSRKATIELVDSKTLAELPIELKEQIEQQCHKILNLLK